MSLDIMQASFEIYAAKFWSLCCKVLEIMLHNFDLKAASKGSESCKENSWKLQY